MEHEMSVTQKIPGNDSRGSAPVQVDQCCGGPAPTESDACCVQDAEAKSAGGVGCGCAPATKPGRPSGCCSR